MTCKGRSDAGDISHVYILRCVNTISCLLHCIKVYTHFISIIGIVTITTTAINNAYPLLKSTLSNNLLLLSLSHPLAYVSSVYVKCTRVALES